MEVKENWEDNLTLNYIEGNTSSADDLEVIWLNFDFYDCNYDVGLSKKDLDSDFLSLSFDGDSKLFDSIQELLENKYAQKIKEQFERYRNFLIEEEEEWNNRTPNVLDTTKYKRVFWKEKFKDQDSENVIEIERSQIQNIDYTLNANEYLK